LIGAFAEVAQAEDAANAFDPELSPQVTFLEDDAWRDEWKKYFEPFSLSAHIMIRPPWRPAPDVASDVRLIEMEPGRAFGTGLHASTALVAQMLDESRASLAGCTMLDVGCGSGILSLIALALFASHVRAIDIDADAVAVTYENAARNGVANKITADTTPIDGVTSAYPVVVANIQADVLIPMAPALAKVTNARGLLIVSGILVPQGDGVLQAFAPIYDLEQQKVQGEWVAFALRKKPV
jgi:ribosomal protein L11 methyltransferase